MFWDISLNVWMVFWIFFVLLVSEMSGVVLIYLCIRYYRDSYLVFSNDFLNIVSDC